MGPASASHKTSAVVIKTYISFSFEAEDDGDTRCATNQGLMGLVLSGAQEAITGVSRGFAGRT
jgi:hypothetical protein